jgi:hypothetical protein
MKKPYAACAISDSCCLQIPQDIEEMINEVDIGKIIASS